MSILSARPVADAVARVFAGAVNPAPRPGVRFPEISDHTTTISIPARHGDVAATVYGPQSTNGDQPAVYVNVHGGGFVVGHREQDDPWCRYLAAHANVVVINTDYVLAAHRRFPAPVEQIYDVLRWASSGEHDWDGRQLCVGGQSAGGNLAAASRLALENGDPAVKLQVLHYAPLDLVTSAKDKRTPLGNGAVLRPWMSEVFDTAYLPDAVQRRHRLASPAWGINADGLDGIAPALVITAEYDPLRDQGEAYAQRLRDAGVPTQSVRADGLFHGFFGMHPFLPPARAAWDTAIGAL
ncbi:MAG: acetyl esterase, partial [Mycobacterium sp.]|nr:acetyl esterase [Mycobacterium sp.]